MIYLEDFYIKNKYYILDESNQVITYANKINNIDDINGFYSKEKKTDVAYFNKNNNTYVYINKVIIGIKDKDLTIRKEKLFFFFTKYIIRIKHKTYQQNLLFDTKLDSFESNIFDTIYDLWITSNSK